MGGGEHARDLARDRARHLLGPGLQQQVGDLIGEFLGAEQEAGEGGHEDQERKQRHQRRQRDVAGDRPAVVAPERFEGVAGGAIPHGDHAQRAPLSYSKRIGWFTEGPVA